MSKSVSVDMNDILENARYNRNQAFDALEIANATIKTLTARVKELEDAESGRPSDSVG